MKWITAKVILGATGAGDDRVEVVSMPEGVVVVVADGAGGLASASAAAEMVVRGVCDIAGELSASRVDPVAVLRELDERVQATGGQSTAVVAIVSGLRVWGASVGDSGAVVCTVATTQDLTEGQRHKPLIGSGVAEPAAFVSGPLRGTLLVATDGLLKYAAWPSLMRTLIQPNLDAIPERLVSLARLRSGALQDDIGLAVCRSARRFGSA